MSCALEYDNSFGLRLSAKLFRLLKWYCSQNHILYSYLKGFEPQSKATSSIASYPNSKQISHDRVRYRKIFVGMMWYHRRRRRVWYLFTNAYIFYISRRDIKCASPNSKSNIHISRILPPKDHATDGIQRQDLLFYDPNHTIISS